MTDLASVSTPLVELKTGERGILLSPDSHLSLSTRMTSLGFTPGVDIQMTFNYGFGPLVVTVRGTRVALGRGEARKTYVVRSEK